MARATSTASLAIRVALAIGWWVGLSIVVGWVASRLRPRGVALVGTFLATRSLEGDGHGYERLGVRRWKRLLPDAGGAFGGRRKRLFGPRGTGGREVLAREVDRAEAVHWCLVVVQWVPAFWLGPLWWLGPAYAIGANLPFIVVLRYVRARLTALGRGRR